ncbi:unnamed protein product [Brassica oleracea var. botrytis]|uniref:(rape) hypothetical protein n=1 Tax=Brassica napus TaxID=3708 RepID=A0A816IXR8_BRANA|nr:unnamed protein product [Brassica napus]
MDGYVNFHPSKEGKKRLVTEFYQRTGKNYNYNKIKNHYDYERKRYTVYMRLKNRTGVTIKEDTGEIDMPEEWWQERSEV